MYASQWFLTLFAINFPFEILERIWDIYLLEGEKTIYRFGVAILVLHEDELLAEDFEKVMDSLKKMYKDVDANKLISTALNLKITNSILQVFSSDLFHQTRICMLNSVILQIRKLKNFLCSNYFHHIL